MAGKVTQYTPATAVNEADLFDITQDVSTTPVTKSATGTQVKHMVGGVNSGPQGFADNYVITTSHSSSLVVSLKTIAVATPTATDKIRVRVGDLEHDITGAAQVTFASGTAWMDMSSTEHAGQEIDLFVYLGRNTSTNTTTFGVSRISHAITYADFSTTSTAETYGRFSAAMQSASKVEVIGRITAELSAGNVFTTPASNVIISRPIYETRWLHWLPTHTGFSSNPSGGIYRYQIKYNNCELEVRESTSGTSNATTFYLSLPFKALTLTNMLWWDEALCTNAGTTNKSGMWVLSAATELWMRWGITATTWTASGNKNCNGGGVKYQIA